VARKQDRGLPAVGQYIYVDSDYYLGHGIDDFEGGLCRVATVAVDEAGGRVRFALDIAPNRLHFESVASFATHQAELRRKFGRRKGYPRPDTGMACNDEWGLVSPRFLAEEGLRIVNDALTVEPRLRALRRQRSELRRLLAALRGGP
jgi:hypothetical protein